MRLLTWTVGFIRLFFNEKAPDSPKPQPSLYEIKKGPFKLDPGGRSWSQDLIWVLKNSKDV
jgi:hypothetical protein